MSASSLVGLVRSGMAGMDRDPDPSMSIDCIASMSMASTDIALGMLSLVLLPIAVLYFLEGGVYLSMLLAVFSVYRAKYGEDARLAEGASTILL